VRGGSDRSAFFLAASGEPPPRPHWPEPDGLPVELPGVLAAAPWKPSPDLDIPLLVEGEAWTLLEGVAKALADELPGARLAEAALEDGASEAWLVNGRGVRCEQRARAAALTLFAVLPAAGASVHLYLAARAARRFEPQRLASRLATQLAARAEGEPVEHERGECVLAPDLVARLVAGLAPLWLGREAAALAASLRDRAGRLASPCLTVVDDPRYDGLLCGEPVDGEGVPTRECLLVEEGRSRESLVDFRQTAGGRAQAAGCCRRPSWRDVPAPGASQLFVRPDAQVRAADLVDSVARGHYLLDAGRPARFHFVDDRFTVPVCGYVLEKGQARAPIARTLLTGSIRALLHGVQAVAADLELYPLGALYGGPTLLVTGLELRPWAS
jgi:PmbA protein